MRRKHALIGLMRTIAKETAGSGIRVLMADGGMHA